MEQMEQMALVGGFSVAAAFQSTADRRLLSRGGFSVARLLSRRRNRRLLSRSAFQSKADRRLLSRGGFSVAAASQSLGFSVDGGWQLHG
jgi:hypothetical protein